DLLAPRIAEPVAQALATLETLPPGANKTGTLTGKELPATGKNYLRGNRVDAARAAYRDYLAFVFFRALLWDANPATPAPATLALAAGAGLDPKSVDGCLNVFRGLGDAAETSLRRDAERGRTVFGDYDAFHPGADADPVCKRLKAELAALEPVLRERLRRIA